MVVCSNDAKAKEQEARQFFLAPSCAPGTSLRSDAGTAALEDWIKVRSPRKDRRAGKLPAFGVAPSTLSTWVLVRALVSVERCNSQTLCQAANIPVPDLNGAWLAGHSGVCLAIVCGGSAGAICWFVRLSREGWPSVFASAYDVKQTTTAKFIPLRPPPPPPPLSAVAFSPGSQDCAVIAHALATMLAVIAHALATMLAVIAHP
eukprot:SAG11_NODE_2091_length_3842_cov_1.651349_2_plen_204_part_00